jgi:hypothetical protein
MRASNDASQNVLGIAAPVRALSATLLQHALHSANGDLVDNSLVVLPLVDLAMARHSAELFQKIPDIDTVKGHLNASESHVVIAIRAIGEIPVAWRKTE